MTTRRAAMPSHRHASPARVHFAYVEIGEDVYYVGIGTVQQRPESLDTHRKGNQQSVTGTAQDVLGRPKHTGLPGAGSQDTGRMEQPMQRPADSRRDAVIPVAQASELKLLPAPPPVAGLLPARVPTPQMNGNLIGKWVKVQGVGVGMVCRMDKRDSGDWYKVGFVCWSTSAVVWKRADALAICEQPDGVTPYQASIKLNVEKAKVSMRG